MTWWQILLAMLAPSLGVGVLMVVCSLRDQRHGTPRARQRSLHP